MVWVYHAGIQDKHWSLINSMHQKASSSVKWDNKIYPSIVANACAILIMTCVSCSRLLISAISSAHALALPFTFPIFYRENADNKNECQLV
jgi:hypothetical protein